MTSGHITSALEKDYPQSRLAQTDQLFRNENGAFVNVTSISGKGFQRVKSSRGAIAGDYDNDGDLDLFVANKNDVPTLLRNEGGNRKHWLTIRTVGTRSNRDGIGAKVRVVVGGRSQTKEVQSGSSYLSQNDMRVSFGLGHSTVVDTLEIRWPSGLVQVFENVKGDRFLKVIEGKGLEEL